MESEKKKELKKEFNIKECKIKKEGVNERERARDRPNVKETA